MFLVLGYLLKRFRSSRCEANDLFAIEPTCIGQIQELEQKARAERQHCLVSSVCPVGSTHCPMVVGVLKTSLDARIGSHYADDLRSTMKARFAKHDGVHLRLFSLEAICQPNGQRDNWGQRRAQVDLRL